MSTPHDPALEPAQGSVHSPDLSSAPAHRPVHATEADGTLEFDIRPTELDSFGHVNNARYLEFLEWARAEWGRVRGLSYDKFREEGQIPAVVEAKLRFLAESKLGDRLRIVSTPELKHAARINFHQEIFNQHGKRVLRAEISVVAVDLKARTFTEFSPLFLEAVRTAQKK